MGIYEDIKNRFPNQMFTLEVDHREPVGDYIINVYDVDFFVSKEFNDFLNSLLSKYEWEEIIKCSVMPVFEDRCANG